MAIDKPLSDTFELIADSVKNTVNLFIYSKDKSVQIISLPTTKDIRMFSI